MPRLSGRGFIRLGLCMVALTLLSSSRVAYCLDDVDRGVCDAYENPDDRRACYEEFGKDGQNLPATRKPPAASSNAPTVGTTSLGVVCNEFDIIAEVSGRELTFRLSSDLPDNTEIMASVSRQYWKEGSEEEYSGPYLSRKTTVGELRRPMGVVIDETKWKNELQKKQMLLAKMGEPFQVRKISNEVELDLTVPINQSNPAFGKGNSNLHGPFVSKQGLRTIRLGKKFNIPFDKNSATGIVGKKQHNLDPNNLETNLRYRISKRTPITDEIQPKDPLKAIAEMKYLPPGSVIRILQKRSIRSTPYDYVNAQVQGGARIRSQAGYTVQH